MELLIENQRQTFMPIRDFRVQHDLPGEFGVALFEAKDFTGLGRLDRAGGELNIVRQAVLDAIPAEMPLGGWLDFLPQLEQLFEWKLHEINPQVGLKDVEIEYAVGGFRDVCEALVYAMIRARAAGTAMPEFRQVYFDWLSDTTRVSSSVHHYIHKGDIWAVQVLHHAYGRTGLVIWTEKQTHYVQDNTLGCPAEGYMASLLHEVATRILTATR